MKQEILDFWFDREGPSEGNHAKAWWVKDPDFDAEIGRRFEGAIERALDGEFDAWADDPQGALALVILLDQFTRNIYRDTPRAFVGDDKALGVTRQAVNRGLDKELSFFRRAFLYMPFEHAEDHGAQEAAIAAFEQLQEDADEKHEEAARMFLDFAHKHKVIIDRFGRYPHRNDILGRETTPEEAAFLEQPGSSF